MSGAISRPDELSPGARVGGAVRELRQAAGFSLSELARRSGVGKATLSELEAGTRNPTLDTLFALTTVLEVPLGAVLEAAGEVRTRGVAVDALLLDRCRSSGRVAETYRLTVASRRQVSRPHAGGTTETLVVVSGRVRVGAADAPVDLDAGEGVTFAADTPHVYQALEGSAVCLLVMTSPTSPA